MKLLALDISTNSGWALLEQVDDNQPTLQSYGVIAKEKTALEYEGGYPKCYRRAAKTLAVLLVALVKIHRPDEVVVEETNRARAVYSQKVLEWIHLYFQQAWDGDLDFENRPEAKYIRTGVWRGALGLKKPLDAKKNDLLLKKAKTLAATGQCSLAEAKKRVGVRGKWNKKMLAVNYVNALYNLNWKLKQNDIAEAVCLGLAYLKGAAICDGDPRPKKEDK